MSPRPIPDPVASAPLVLAFALSSLAAAVVAGAAIGRWIYELATKEKD